MNLREFDRRHHHVLTIVAIVLSVLIVGLVFILLSQPVQEPPAPVPQPAPEPAGPTVCTTDECFLELANDCEQASYTKQIKTGTFELSISEECRLTKKLIALVESEPDRMKDMLEGKSMRCVYEQGNFNEGYLELFTGNVFLCEGALRDAIEAIAD